MFRQTALRLCGYRARFEQLKADPNTVLGGPSYGYLQSQLDQYCGLLNKYGGKQTEMERVKKLGRQLGFEFTKGKTRQKPE